MPPQLQPTPPVRLQPCCRKALAAIGDALKRARVTRPLVATSGLLTMLYSPPSSVGDDLLSITTTDWSLFAQAVKGVTAFAMSECQSIAWEQYQAHPGGPLNQFWERMLNQFGVS